jgi:hypothetical protein
MLLGYGCRLSYKQLFSGKFKSTEASDMEKEISEDGSGGGEIDWGRSMTHSN